MGEDHRALRPMEQVFADIGRNDVIPTCRGGIGRIIHDPPLSVFYDHGVARVEPVREQWIAWYICAALEAVINILSGQYVLLILKLGYFTNTTYGYIKWTKYIKSHQEEKKLSLF